MTEQAATATKTGRPAIGPEVKTRLYQAEVSALDERAAALRIDRSELLRRYIRAGLARPVATVQVERYRDGVWQPAGVADVVEGQPGESSEDAAWTIFAVRTNHVEALDEFRALWWPGTDTTVAPRVMTIG